MKYKTATLEGALLDAAVAKARGWTLDNDVWCTDPEWPNDPIKLGEPGEWYEGEHFAPSTDWRGAGPIVERERITIVWDGRANEGHRAWNAYAFPADGAWPPDYSRGPTPLIAAMRAFVFAKLGEWVELP